MSFLDPAQARAIYQTMMKEKLYACIGEDEELKDYVDNLYLVDKVQAVAIQIIILICLAGIFIRIVYPMVAAVLP